MSTSLFTGYLTARWRITLGVGAVLLFLIALTWQYDVPDFDASEDGSASRYLQGFTGKISNALPDWASSKSNGEESADGNEYDQEEPAPPKEFAVPTRGTGPQPEAKPSAHGVPPTVQQSTDSHVSYSVHSEHLTDHDICRATMSQKSTQDALSPTSMKM